MIKRKINSKVCIIGAGPAGTSTSIFLAKQHVEHLIVDAAIFPREKVCGDGLDAMSLRILNHLDKDIIPNELFNHEHFLPSWGLRCIKPSGKQIDFSLKQGSGVNSKECPFFVSKRFYLDEFLVKKINPQFADFRQNTRITNIIKEGETWILEAIDGEGELEINCQFLVGADGDHSVVLKHLGMRKIDRKHYASSVRQYYQQVEGMHPDNLLEFYFLKNIPMGYFWIFPLPGGECNVGFGVQSEVISKQKINLKNVFEKIISSDPAIASRFKNAKPIGEVQGWGLPFASLKRKNYGDGWLLAGDAASMITPTNGEGIGNALKCGVIAARLIKKAVQENDFSEKTFVNYSRETLKQMNNEITYHNLTRKFPFLSNGLINAFIQDTSFHQRYIKNIIKGWVNTSYHKSFEVHD